VALTNAEKQQRYRARHVMVPRETAALPLASPIAPVCQQGVPDLTAVRAALAEARKMLANTSPYPGTMARQIQQVFAVLVQLVEALEAPRGP